jgi:hypothetical protein
MKYLRRKLFVSEKLGAEKRKDSASTTLKISINFYYLVLGLLTTLFQFRMLYIVQCRLMRLGKDLEVGGWEQFEENTLTLACEDWRKPKNTSQNSL